MDASLGHIVSKVGEHTKSSSRRRFASGAARGHRPASEVADGILSLSARIERFPLICYVKHRPHDEPAERFRCATEAKAHAIRRDRREADEVAWVEDEEGRAVKALGADR